MHVPANVQLCPDNGLDALLVARTDKLKRPHHVPVVGDGHGRHAHGLRGGDQFPDGTDGLQDAELGMDVQMRKGHLGQSRGLSCGSSSLSRGCLLGLGPSGVRLGEIGLLQGRSFVDHLFGRHKFGPGNDADADHFKEAPRGGRHVVGGIVGIAKSLPKQFLVQLRQGGPLEFSASSAWDGAMICPFVLGIDQCDVGQCHGVKPQAHQFRTRHIHIEPDVVAHDIGGLDRVGHEGLHHLGKWCPLFLCTLRGDAVDLGGVERNREPIGAHHMVPPRQQLARFIVKLPRQLHQSGPVVPIGDGGIPIPWQARGFRIVNENHGAFEIRETSLKRTSLVQGCFPHCIPTMGIWTASTGLPP